MGVGLYEPSPPPPKLSTEWDRVVTYCIRPLQPFFFSFFLSNVLIGFGLFFFKY